MENLLYLILSVCVSRAFGVYFIMGEKETRCFIDDFSEGSVISYRYNATVGKDSPIGLVVRVTDPSRKVILKREYGSGSTVSFKADETGEYALCVSTNSTKWAMYATGTVKVHFKFEADYTGVEKVTDDDEEDPDEEVPEGDHQLASFRQRVKDVMRSVRFIVKSMESHRFAEERFRSIAETTNSRVLLWATLQVGLLLLTGFWQMRNLKVFFIAKKIV